MVRDYKFRPGKTTESFAGYISSHAMRLYEVACVDFEEETLL